MREIKFRAWDKKNSIYYKSIWNLCFIFGGVRFAWDDYENSDGETMITDLPKGDFELMQYTGLKDKNGTGKEAYISDIAKDEHGNIFEIVDDYAFLAHLSTIWFEIIGNIYEDSHLLK